jgi:hypothetical protein
VKVKVLRYELTDDGKKFYQEKEVPGLIGEKESRGDICFGQQALDTVIKTEGPITVGDKKEMTLYYTYKIENLADWAKNPDIQRAIPRNRPHDQRSGKDNAQSELDSDRPRMGSEVKAALFPRFAFLFPAQLERAATVL